MRYFCKVEYDGSDYHGWAFQENYLTVQGEIESVLSTIFSKKIKIHASGRTDKYVHALNQCFHFDIDTDLNINDNFLKNINSYFKNKIKIKSFEKIDEKFHSRFNVKEKVYLYKINTKENNIFNSKYVYQYCKKINLKKIKKTSKLFIGKHNFLSYSTSEKENTIRNINWIKIKRKKGEIWIYISGNGFLRNMVRMIIGSLLDINEGKKDNNDIINLLNNPLKGSSISKAPGCGLYLYDVKY